MVSIFLLAFVAYVAVAAAEFSRLDGVIHTLSSVAVLLLPSLERHVHF